MPSLAASRITSTGNCFSSSQRTACGAIFSAANSRAMSRTAIWSSLRANWTIPGAPLGEGHDELGEIGTFDFCDEFLVRSQHLRVPPARGLKIDEIVNWMAVVACVLQRGLNQVIDIKQSGEESWQSSHIFRSFERSDQFLYRFASKSISDLNHDQPRREQCVIARRNLVCFVRSFLRHKPFHCHACIDHEVAHSRPSLISSSVSEG